MGKIFWLLFDVEKNTWLVFDRLSHLSLNLDWVWERNTNHLKFNGWGFHLLLLLISNPKIILRKKISLDMQCDNITFSYLSEPHFCGWNLSLSMCRVDNCMFLYKGRERLSLPYAQIHHPSSHAGTQQFSCVLHPNCLPLSLMIHEPPRDLHWTFSQLRLFIRYR